MSAFAENRTNLTLTDGQTAVRVASVRRSNPLADAHPDDMPRAGESAGDFERYRGMQVGDRVFSTQYNCEGTVRFVGLHHQKATPRVGVELDMPVGKLDGRQGGYRYFTCGPNCGILTSPNKVSRLNSGGVGKGGGDVGRTEPPQSRDVYGVATKFGAASASQAEEFYETAAAVVEEEKSFAARSATMKSHSGKSAHLREESSAVYAMMVPQATSPDLSTRAPRGRKGSEAAQLVDVGRRVRRAKEAEAISEAESPGCSPPLPRRNVNDPFQAKLPHTGPLYDAPGFIRVSDLELVQRLVLGALPGNYLIRESRSTDNLVLVLNERGSISNFTVFVNRGPAAAAGAFTIQDSPCASLASVVEFAQANLKSYVHQGKSAPLGMPVPLDPWFAGHYTKAEVEAAVLAVDHGKFLIRKSSDGRKFVVVVHDCGQAANFTIDPVPSVKSNAPTQSFSFGTLSFDSLQAVVAWLQKNNLRGLATEKLRVTEAAPFEGNSHARHKPARNRYENITVDGEHGYENVPKGGLLGSSRGSTMTPPASTLPAGEIEWGFGDDE